MIKFKDKEEFNKFMKDIFRSEVHVIYDRKGEIFNAYFEVAKLSGYIEKSELEIAEEKFRSSFCLYKDGSRIQEYIQTTLNFVEELRKEIKRLKSL